MSLRQRKSLGDLILIPQTILLKVFLGLVRMPRWPGNTDWWGSRKAAGRFSLGPGSRASTGQSLSFSLRSTGTLAGTRS